jgi:hypothetical protein
MWHTLATDGVACRWLLKDRRAEIAALVADPAWSVSVADHGRQHVAYLAPVARPGRMRVGFDGRLVDVDASDWDTLWSIVQDAYLAGATKRALLCGLGHNEHRRLGVARARQVEAALTAWRGSTTLTLAVWLAHHHPSTEEDT